MMFADMYWNCWPTQPIRMAVWPLLYSIIRQIQSSPDVKIGQLRPYLSPSPLATSPHISISHSHLFRVCHATQYSSPHSHRSLNLNRHLSLSLSSWCMTTSHQHIIDLVIGQSNLLVIPYCRIDYCYCCRCQRPLQRPPSSPPLWIMIAS